MARINRIREVPTVKSPQPVSIFYMAHHSSRLLIGNISESLVFTVNITLKQDNGKIQK
jgi:hypothetical protein